MNRSVIFMLVLVGAAVAGWALFQRGGAPPQRERTAVAPAVHEAVSVREPASGPSLPEPAEVGSGEPVQAAHWTRRYHESTDDFSLARDLAAAAVNDDGQAQDLLGRLLLRCEVYKRILAPYTEGSVAERVEFHLASSTFAEQGRSEFRRGALRCGRLFTEDPFAGYGLTEEAKDFRYWAEKAVESGDALAVINNAFRSATDQRETEDLDEARAFRDSLLSDVRRVVFSGNGAALYVLGGMFSHPSIGAVPDDGYAWIVAACESGYDCSNANPDVGAGCVERATCEPGQTFLDVLQRDLGAGKYAAIYANAQDIQYKIKTNDWDGLQQYLRLK
jgi:hypothetical protein